MVNSKKTVRNALNPKGTLLYDCSFFDYFSHVYIRDQRRRRIHISENNDDQKSSSLFLLKKLSFDNFVGHIFDIHFKVVLNSLLAFKILDAQVLLNTSDSIVLLNIEISN